LRDMEDEGIVTSEWDPDSLGPQRRVYRITAAGEQHLRAWIADLRRTRQEIDHLVEAYERMDMRKGGE
jgi:PadR family transcriptional regulator PadR